MNRILAAIVGLVVAAFVIRASTFIVDQRQSAIVFQLGQIKRVDLRAGPVFPHAVAVQNVVYQDDAS